MEQNGTKIKNIAPFQPQKVPSQPPSPKLKPAKMEPNGTKWNGNKKIPHPSRTSRIILSLSKDATPTLKPTKSTARSSPMTQQTPNGDHPNPPVRVAVWYDYI